MFLRYLLVVIAVNCENSSESDKLLVNERDSECHKAVVSDSEVLLLLTVKIAVRVTNLVNERDSECHKTVVSDSEVLLLL